MIYIFSLFKAVCLAHHFTNSAETEFRHEVEITIEPFKGLLMGLFFLSVGMGIDLRALLAEGNGPALERVFDEASRARNTWADKAFPAPPSGE